MEVAHEGVMNYPKVAVQILLYNESTEEIDRLFTSLANVDYPNDRWLLAIVNNVHPSHAIESYMRDRWLKEGEQTLPQIRFFRQEPNNGFAGGHERAYQLSVDWSPDYVYLLNADAYVEPSFLWRAVQAAEANERCALVQSRIMLAQEPELLNSSGNAMHFLGFGFSLGYKQRIDATQSLPTFYASGAGVLARVSAVKAIGGLFAPEYFLYHEDLDLSWRARLAGYDIFYAQDSVIYHRYEFSRSIQKFYWMERNRHLTNLINYKIGTLLLIAPAAFVMELGTLWFARKSGWGMTKLKTWLYFLKPSTWIFILRRRALVKQIRVVADRSLLTHMVGVIENQEVENALLTRVVNPILSVYFFLLKLVVRW